MEGGRQGQGLEFGEGVGDGTEIFDDKHGFFLSSVEFEDEIFAQPVDHDSVSTSVDRMYKVVIGKHDDIYLQWHKLLHFRSRNSRGSCSRTFPASCSYAWMSSNVKGTFRMRL